MRKNINTVLPVFCGVYYAVLSMLYGGDIFTVGQKADETTVPLNWIILAGTTLFVLCSLFIPKLFKNHKAGYIINAIFAAGLSVYSICEFLPFFKSFIENGSYSLPLFTVIYAASFCYLAAAYVILIFKNGSDENEKRQ